MTITAKIEGLDRLNAKLLKLAGSGNVAVLQKANQKSAKDFQALVRATAPKDPETKHGHLVDTLTERLDGYAVAVSIGDANHPYPLHLEVGHRARDGAHVPAKAFWFPAIRVLKKRRRGQIARAEKAFAKQIAAGGGD
jgi:hypothetical protein